jgi:peptide/nickel transport system permease protein
LTRYLARRAVGVLIVLVGISIVVFLMVRLIPGDTVQLLLGTEASQEQINTLRRVFGLDRPLHQQFMDWFRRLAQGDFGISLRTSRPVLPDIIARFGVTVQLTAASMLVALVVAVPLGVASAVNRSSVTDAVARVTALVGLSVPNFWLGTVLILFVSLVLGWLPPIGFISVLDNPWLGAQTLLLPSIALGTALAAFVMRMVRSTLLEVLRQDYIRTARAKGLRERVVLYTHALKNAFIPVLTVIGVQIGHLLGGAVIIEEVFSLPGVGTFLLNGIYQRDYPVIQGGVLFVALVFSLLNLLVDVLYGWIDPRIRY